jgi:transglutaminase-like putative cysteine protease
MLVPSARAARAAPEALAAEEDTMQALDTPAPADRQPQSQPQPAAQDDPALYLRATDVIDWTHPAVLALARGLGAGRSDPVDVSRACFEWVRDEVRHCIDYNLDALTCAASDVLRERTGFCYAKSHLLVALLRANGIPAGLCYQRLTRDDTGRAFVLHGLAAVQLPGLPGPGWYRADPRGNNARVDARFTPPVERLAYPTTAPGEYLFPGIYPDPAPVVVAALRSGVGAQSLRGRLPDPRTEDELLRPAAP